jgi:hypothetical protein
MPVYGAPPIYYDAAPPRDGASDAKARVDASDGEDVPDASDESDESDDEADASDGG